MGFITIPRTSFKYKTVGEFTLDNDVSGEYLYIESLEIRSPDRITQISINFCKAYQFIIHDGEMFDHDFVFLNNNILNLFNESYSGGIYKYTFKEPKKIESIRIPESFVISRSFSTPDDSSDDYFGKSFQRQELLSSVCVFHIATENNLSNIDCLEEEIYTKNNIKYYSDYIYLQSYVPGICVTKDIVSIGGPPSKKTLYLNHSENINLEVYSKSKFYDKLYDRTGVEIIGSGQRNYAFSLQDQQNINEYPTSDISVIKTGKTWFNYDPIYKATFSVSSSGDSRLYYPLGEINIYYLLDANNIVSIKGAVYENEDYTGAMFPVNGAHTSTAYVAGAFIQATTNYLTLSCGASCDFKSGFIEIEFTSASRKNSPKRWIANNYGLSDIKASSTWSTTYPAKNAFDLNIETSWSSASGKAKDEYVSCCLPAPLSNIKIKLYNRHHNNLSYIKNGRIIVSNNNFEKEYVYNTFENLESTTAGGFMAEISGKNEDITRSFWKYIKIVCDEPCDSNTYVTIGSAEITGERIGEVISYWEEGDEEDIPTV